MSAAALLLSTAIAAAGTDCSDSTQAAGPCTIKIHECYGFYDWQWKYAATATDLASGKVGGSLADHYDSQTGAGTHATYDLFNNRLTSTPTSDDCSCQHEDVPVGSCLIRSAVCAMFNTTSDVSKGAAGISYRATAWDVSNTNCTASVSNYANETEAGTDAGKALFSVCPAMAVKCFNATEEAL